MCLRKTGLVSQWATMTMMMIEEWNWFFIIVSHSKCIFSYLVEYVWYVWWLLWYRLLPEYAWMFDGTAFEGQWRRSWASTRFARYVARINTHMSDFVSHICELEIYMLFVCISYTIHINSAQSTANTMAAWCAFCHYYYLLDDAMRYFWIFIAIANGFRSLLELGVSFELARSFGRLNSHLKLFLRLRVGMLCGTSDICSKTEFEWLRNNRHV